MKISQRYPMVSLYILLAGLLGTSLGCSPNTFSLDRGSSLTTEANTRLMLNTSPRAIPRPGLVQPQRIVCVEPSPDVAIAITEVFKAEFNADGDAGGKLSRSEVRDVLQLAQRTATLQLLREQMYRACEAYANGAISGTTYSLITSKNNKTMVSLLLGETVVQIPEPERKTKIHSEGKVSNELPPDAQIDSRRSELFSSSAETLKEMQAQFLHDDYLDELVSTCLVELGLNTEQRHYLDPINTTFREIFKQFSNSAENLKAKRHKQISNELETALIRMNDTYLSRLCKAELPKILRHQEKREMLLSRETALKELNQALERCSALSDKGEVSDRCASSVMSLATTTHPTEDEQQMRSELLESFYDERAQLRNNYVALHVLKFRGEAAYGRVTRARDLCAPILERRDKEETDAIVKEVEKKMILSKKQLRRELESVPIYISLLPDAEDDVRKLHEYLNGAQQTNRRYILVMNEMENAIRLGELYAGSVHYLAGMVEFSTRGTEVSCSIDGSQAEGVDSQ